MEEMKITFERSAELGEGTYGHVYRGEFEGRQVAVKRVLLQKANINEEESLFKLDHPNVIKLYHCESDENFRIYALELCAASLQQVFSPRDDAKKYEGPKLPNHYVIFSQLASGLEHIHSKDLTHRDIKPSNVLIMPSPGEAEEIIMKLADFGVSRPVNERGTYTLSGVKGSTNWYAPELLKILNEAQNIRGTVKSDVFSLGLVFGYILLKGKHPYGSSDSEIRNNLLKKKMIKLKDIYHLHYAYDLLKKMLAHGPTDRVTSTDVVIQLQFKKNKIERQEKEFFKLCANEDEIHDANERLKNFIRKGIDINAHDKNRCNALHLLCENNSNENVTTIMALLIQLGIDINAKNACGNNALHVLCQFNSSKTLVNAIKVLIQHKINVADKDEFEQNALHILCRYNCNENLCDVIKLLTESGIDANEIDGHKRNALHILCQHNSSENLLDTAKLLIQLGVDVNARDADGWNALHFLCKHNSSEKLIETIEFVIQCGIDKASDGLDALSLLRDNASQRNVDDIIHFFQTTIPLTPNEIDMDTN